MRLILAAFLSLASLALPAQPASIAAEGDSALEPPCERGALGSIPVHIVDVRSPAEFEAAHVAGAVNVPLDLLATVLPAAWKNEPVALYCVSGRRSASAAALARSLGFADVHDLGGLASRLSPDTHDGARLDAMRDAPPGHPPIAGDAIATVGDREILYGSVALDPAAEFARVDSYEALLSRLGDQVARTLVELEAERLGLPADELQRRARDEAENALSGPSLLEAVRAAAMRAPLDLPAAFYRRLEEAYPVRYLLPPLRVSVASGGLPGFGSASAPIDIVAFTDLSCPYCRIVESAILEAVGRCPGLAQAHLRDLPAGQSAMAWAGARFFRAAAAQGCFWELRRKLIDGGMDQVEYGPGAAAGLGLDQERFVRDFNSAELLSGIEADRLAASALGIGCAPLLLVNGRLVRASDDADAIALAAAEELDIISRARAGTAP